MQTFTVEIDGIELEIVRDDDGKFIIPDEWRGIGSALKPANEPICLARKPLEQGLSIAANVLQHGTGAINVDACRIEGQAQPFGNGTARSGGIMGESTERGEWNPTASGRWPANIIHDGSDEVVAAFPDVGLSSGGMNRTGFSKDPGWDRPSHANWKPSASQGGFGDSGSAARFFYQAAKDDRCDLCDADIATKNLPTKNIQTGNSADIDVPDLLSPVVADKGPHKNGHANSAVNHSSLCHPQKASIAANHAQSQRLQKIVQNVSSAANLCGSCATAIAQEIVAASRKEPSGQSVSKCSIEGFKKTILLRCLASYVESRENTDTILTTTNLRELFGCVFHAIAESIKSARAGSEASTERAPKRLWYSSKADADDRLGSKHPTVKPVDLMQWLVRLVTPKGGLVLDPFAGTGTTAEACYREGMRCMLVERETEYQTDIRRRMALVLGGPDERRRESIKAKTKDQPIDHGPLFAASPAGKVPAHADSTPSAPDLLARLRGKMRPMDIPKLNAEEFE